MNLKSKVLDNIFKSKILCYMKSVFKNYTVVFIQVKNNQLNITLLSIEDYNVITSLNNPS